jgi:hypothetical protein
MQEFFKHLNNDLPSPLKYMKRSLGHGYFGDSGSQGVLADVEAEHQLSERLAGWQHGKELPHPLPGSVLPTKGRFQQTTVTTPQSAVIMRGSRHGAAAQTMDRDMLLECVQESAEYHQANNMLPPITDGWGKVRARSQPSCTACLH